MVGVLPGAINSRVCAEAELARGEGGGGGPWVSSWQQGLGVVWEGPGACCLLRSPLGSECQALAGVGVCLVPSVSLGP